MLDGFTEAGGSYPFALAVIPEPATTWLATIALATLAIFATFVLINSSKRPA